MACSGLGPRPFVLFRALALLLLFANHPKARPITERPNIIAHGNAKVFEMPHEMARRLREENATKAKRANSTMLHGNQTHLLSKLSGTIGNRTMRYYDKTTLDANTDEGKRNLRELAEAGARKVELPPSFIVSGFEPLMHLAPFAVTLDADEVLNVRYTIDGTEPTRDSPAVRGGDSIVIEQPTTILRAFTQANSKYSWKDSKETAAYYTVLTGRHGVGYLVPYYNALPGYSGKMVSIDLKTEKFNQLRVHNIRTDFANYYSEMIRLDTYGVKQVFKAGTGAYMPAKEGQSAASGTPEKQLIIRDYSQDALTTVDTYGDSTPGTWEADENLKGFQGGFTATYSRRVSSLKEQVNVSYDNRNVVEQCVQTGTETRITNLMPWYTQDLIDVMYTKAPTPSNPLFVSTTGAPTPSPTVEVDMRSACQLKKNDDITSYVKSQTKVQEINYGFLVPFYNGVGYRGKAVRITMSHTQRTYTETIFQRTTYICCIPSSLFYWGLSVLGKANQGAGKEKDREPYRLQQYCCKNETLNTSAATHTYYTWDRWRNASYANGYVRGTTNQTSGASYKTLDFSKKDSSLVGFAGGFSYGEYAYYVPFFDGYGYGHKVARVHIHKFDQASLQMLNLWKVSTDLAGFFGGFSYMHQSATNRDENGDRTYGRVYGYLIPHRNTYGPVGKRNTQLTVDGFTGEKVSEGRYAYGGDHLVVKYHGQFVRMSLNDSNWLNYAEQECTSGRPEDEGEDDYAANCPSCTIYGTTVFGPQCVVHPTYDVIDLSQYDPDLRGFAGGFVGGKYAYLAPYKNKIGTAGYFGKVVRINLEKFEIAGVLDLTQNNPSLVGFIGAFLHGNTGILVPHRNDPITIDRTDGGANYYKHHGQLVRFSLSNELFVDGDFAGQVGNLILTNISRMQVPDKADQTLRGYAGGFAVGDYIYLAPHFNNRFHGKLTRVDMRDFDYHVQEQFQCTSFLCGFSAIESQDGVQYINLEESDSELVGFSGGFPGPGDTPIPVTLLETGGGDRKARNQADGANGHRYKSSNAAYEYQGELVGRVPAHPAMTEAKNVTRIDVISRRLASICANLPTKYQYPNYDLCGNVYNRTKDTLVDTGIDITNSPMIVCSTGRANNDNWGIGQWCRA